MLLTFVVITNRQFYESDKQTTQQQKKTTLFISTLSGVSVVCASWRETGVDIIFLIIVKWSGNAVQDMCIPVFISLIKLCPSCCSNVTHGWRYAPRMGPRATPAFGQVRTVGHGETMVNHEPCETEETHGKQTGQIIFVKWRTKQVSLLTIIIN